MRIFKIFKIFKMIKIRTKLLVLITVMVSGLLAVGAIGILVQHNSSKAMESLYTDNQKKNEILADYRALTNANYANILNLMITVDEEQKQIITDDYKKNIKLVNKDLKDFSEMKMNEKETTKYQLILTNSGFWNQIANAMVVFINGGNVDGAKLLYQNAAGYVKYKDLQTAIEDLTKYNVKQAEKIYKHNEDDQEKSKWLLIAAMLLTVVLCIALAVLITISITGPISKIIKLIDKTANLDLTVEESFHPLLSRRDETGQIANAMQGLRNSLRAITGNILSISNNLSSNSDELATATKENTRAINQVVVAINEIAQGNGAQAEMVERTSETIKAMADSIEEVNKATNETSTIAKESILTLEEGQKAIDTTIDKIKLNKKVTGDVGNAIQDLSSQMDKVRNIVKVINDISKQTNLLSLNASIEAARSGEAGRGFAVVASEIGGLANETASAVREITSIVQDTIEKNEKTAHNNEIAKDLSIQQEVAVGIMKEAFDKIKLSVNDITERTFKIAEQIENINLSSKQISDQTSDISATAEEGAASSEEISATNEEQLASIELIAAAAHSLSEVAAELNAEINKFKFDSI